LATSCGVGRVAVEHQVRDALKPASNCDDVDRRIAQAIGQLDDEDPRRAAGNRTIPKRWAVDEQPERFEQLASARASPGYGRVSH